MKVTISKQTGIGEALSAEITLKDGSPQEWVKVTTGLQHFDGRLREMNRRVQEAMMAQRSFACSECGHVLGEIQQMVTDCLDILYGRQSFQPIDPSTQGKAGDPVEGPLPETSEQPPVGEKT